MNENMQAWAQPHSYNLQLAEEKGLASGGEFTAEYHALRRFYAAALLKYLNQKIELEEIDFQLSVHELRFLPATETKTVYQQEYAGGMTYCFLRSNVCVEYLSEPQLDTLRLAAGEVSAEVLRLVEETFLTVTLAAHDTEESTIIIYEPDGKMAPNRGIVIGLATEPEFDAEEHLVNPQAEEEKILFLRLLSETLEKELPRFLGCPVTFFIY